MSTPSIELAPRSSDTLIKVLLPYLRVAVLIALYPKLGFATKLVLLIAMAAAFYMGWRRVYRYILQPSLRITLSSLGWLWYSENDVRDAYLCGTTKTMTRDVKPATEPQH